MIVSSIIFILLNRPVFHFLHFDVALEPIVLSYFSLVTRTPYLFLRASFLRSLRAYVLEVTIMTVCSSSLSFILDILRALLFFLGSSLSLNDKTEFNFLISQEVFIEKEMKVKEGIPLVVPTED